MKGWIHGAIPALLIHFSIGTVYCWSIFSNEISIYISTTKTLVEWAFSLAIFFLGISAAFFGGLIERDIHKSSLLSLICFCSGMLGTGLFIYLGGYYKINNIHSSVPLLGIYLCYGVIMGIGLGVGYVTPVKTLMLWFKDNKGLATGLAVMGFGAAKAIASPIMLYIMRVLSNYNIETCENDGSGLWKMFIVLGLVYMVLMLIAHLLLKKPEEMDEHAKRVNIEAIDGKVNIKSILKDWPIRDYIGIWFIFYINITCGLALISQEKMIVQGIGLYSLIGLISMLSSFSNAAGRLFLAMAGDRLKYRKRMYVIILIGSVVALILTVSTQALYNSSSWYLQMIVLNSLVIINAGYGGGFSNIAPLLSDYYGIEHISKLHGLTLSAWAFAGLTGNQLANFIITHTGKIMSIEGTDINMDGYNNLFIILMILYLSAAFILMKIYNVGGNRTKYIRGSQDKI